jgi:hypothetical protein
MEADAGVKQFKSWRSYLIFAHRVQFRRRFIADKEMQEFLETVLETSSHRIEKVMKRTILWRAQLGCEIRPHYDNDELIFQTEEPYPPERMKPLPGQASEGRLNPKGIPCLYLSTERDTALAEVRPWIGSLVSVAQFEILGDLRVVDCSKNHAVKTPYMLGEIDSSKREEFVWAHIDKAFSRPIQSSDRSAEYVPTQIITELFKVNGFDGIKYQSSLGKGQNLALFDLSCAVVNSCVLYETDKIKFSFSEAARPPHSTRITSYRHGRE